MSTVFESANNAAEQAGSNWEDFSVEKWRSGVFTAKSYFTQLYKDTNTFILEEIKKLDDKPNVVEVGCGTGESLFPLSDVCNECLGIDFNPQFIDFCNKNLNASKHKNVRFEVMDACNMMDELGAKFMERAVVPTCVGNTLGIMPVEIRTKAIVAMGDVAGTNGVAIAVFWNGNCFGDAIQHFYYKNPQLCGPFTGKDVDIANCVLKTDSGYRTHWTTPEEARGEIEGLGMEIVRLEERGRGVLVAYRKKK